MLEAQPTQKIPTEMTASNRAHCMNGTAFKTYPILHNARSICLMKAQSNSTLILLCLLLQISWAAGEKPNIIVIMGDDMGYSDIGCYGSEIDTPNLNTLAENGLRFTQFYNTARCCPTRASLLTGLLSRIRPESAG